MESKKYSLCLTTYNRVEPLIKAFEQVIDDHRIDEIIISDDASEGSLLFFLKYKLIKLSNHKIKFFSNPINLGMSANKAKSIGYAKNEWCILFDSDNVLTPKYLDALDSIDRLTNTTIYCPSFAAPQFDYKDYSGKRLTSETIQPYLNQPMMGCLLNTCNYVVAKEYYLEVFKENTEIKGTDTLWFNYLWLKQGYSMFVVPKMEYFHQVHDGSEWLKHAQYNMNMANELMEAIENL